MSRFDRQGTEGGDLPALLGTATEEFRRSLERHVQQVVEAAKNQAAEIERDADRSANQRRQELAVKARELDVKAQEIDAKGQELVQGVVARAASVLDSIELVQSAISGMLAELRAEVKSLESGAATSQTQTGAPRKPQAILGPRQDQRPATVSQPSSPTQPSPPRPEAPKPAPPQAPAGRPAATTPAPDPAIGARPQTKPQTSAAPSPPPMQPPPVEEAAGDRRRSEAEPPQRPQAQPDQTPGPLIESEAAESKPRADRNADSSAEFDQMIHGEIRRMFHSGKSREDVESFLARFELGDNYLGLLDELYSQKESGRRRIFGRRRDR